jgi:sulfite oxidase
MMSGKRRDIIVRDRLPFNAEPLGSVLARAEITALDAFYSRNHGRFPDIARDEWRLTVDGMVANSRTLTYDELVTSFTAYSVVATLACAGNCAHGAIPTAEWLGARLSDVLESAGVPASTSARWPGAGGGAGVHRSSQRQVGSP